MKKFIIGIITAILFAVSCSNGDKMDTTVMDDNSTIYATKFEFDGHQYIRFVDPIPLSYDNYTGFVHDPDCPCHRR